MLIIDSTRLLCILGIAALTSTILLMTGLHLYDRLSRTLSGRLKVGMLSFAAFYILYIVMTGVVNDYWVISVELIRELPPAV